MNKRESAVAVCGIDCFLCEFYGDNMTDQMRNYLATIMKTTVDKIVPCKGCREQKGCLIHPKCATYDCVQEKKIDFCFECSGFPCEKLQPASDMAEKLPHNIKLYNLCRIKLVGLEKWINEESKMIKDKYYKGKMVIGSGPSL